jgi:hypothetical protein
MIMSIEKKQSYAAFCRDMARKTPDYRIGALADMWAADIYRERMNAGTTPGIIETREIKKECEYLIYAAVESGELDATFPEEDIIPAGRSPKTGEIVIEESNPPCLWIVETPKYIEWARANGAGPRDLVEDNIEDIEIGGKRRESSSQSKQSDILDERERQTLLAIIYALCNKSGISPVDRGLAAELAKITTLLEIPKSEGAIREHLKRASRLIE